MKYFLITLIFLQTISTVNALEVKGFKPDASVEYKKTDKKPLKLHFFYPPDYKKIMLKNTLPLFSSLVVVGALGLPASSIHFANT
ncbi:MAG: hypothetical protein QMB90_09600 [Rubritalea sp.]|tara:strand:+ start:329 stop:583 length:255 start_codon:yes stop_codon:yes gene_type:complete